MSRTAKNKLQNFLIVLLSVTAALLFLQNRRLTQGESGLLSRLFADPGTAIADSMGQTEAAALPLRFAAAGDYAAYGELGMTTADEAFSSPAPCCGKPWVPPAGGRQRTRPPSSPPWAGPPSTTTSSPPCPPPSWGGTWTARYPRGWSRSGTCCSPSRAAVSSSIAGTGRVASAIRPRSPSRISRPW